MNRKTQFKFRLYTADDSQNSAQAVVYLTALRRELSQAQIVLHVCGLETTAA